MPSMNDASLDGVSLFPEISLDKWKRRKLIKESSKPEEMADVIETDDQYGVFPNHKHFTQCTACISFKNCGKLVDNCKDFILDSHTE